MAVDTALKRFSIINISLPSHGPMIPPSGTVSQAERQAFMWWYAGILWTGVVAKGDLGDPINMSPRKIPYHELSRPLAVISQWYTVIDAGGVDDSDNGGSDIDNPDTQIGDSDHHLLKVQQRGSFIQLRLVYDDGLSSITDPVFQVFGRYNETEQWQRLKNLNDAVDVTVATNALDVTDGAMNYSDPDPQDQTVDLDATDEVIIAVKAPLSATGDVTTATLQAKLIGGIRAF